MLAVANDHPSITSVNGCRLTALGEEGMNLSLHAVCDSAGTPYQTRLDRLETANERLGDPGIPTVCAAKTIELRDVRSE